MKIESKLSVALILALLVFISASMSSCSSTTSAGTTVTPFAFNDSDVVGGIFKPTSKPGGYTYAQWSVFWWQWAYIFPATNPPGTIANPLLDTTGSLAYLGANQNSLPVFLLGGLFTKGNTASNTTRTVIIPKEYAIFFPVAAIMEDSIVAGTSNTGTMQNNLEAFIGQAGDRNVKLDNVVIFTVAISQPFRTHSPQFSYALPNNNIYQFFGRNAPSEVVNPAFADGYYVFLPPLAAGKHTLYFNSTVNGILQQMTYNITTN